MPWVARSIMSNTVSIGDFAETPKLRVLPKGRAMVPHYEQQAAGVRRFHGWTHDPAKGPSFLDNVSKQTKNHGGFVKGVRLVLELPVTPEYIRALRDGDFWPADEATAQMIGIAFDPSFGGEHGTAPPLSVKSTPDTAKVA